MIMRFPKLFLSFLALIASVASVHEFIAAPTNKTGKPALLVFIQGASISNDRYIPIMQAIQEEAAFPLHVVLPEFLFDVSIPFLTYLHQVMQDSHKVIPAQVVVEVGKNRFLGGHSLGAHAAQIEGYYNRYSYLAAFNFGASLERQYNLSYPLPILSVNGELDGLQKITRVAEAFYNGYDRQKKDVALGTWEHPIVLVPGMNHMQFADGQDPTMVVEKLDLIPDIETKVAHTQVAKVVSRFLEMHIDGKFSASTEVSSLPPAVKDAFNYVSSLVTESRKMVGPLIEGYRLEASPFLFPACNSDTPAPHCPFYPAFPPQKDRVPSSSSDCSCGSPFSRVAVQIMAGLDASKYPLQHADAIHDLVDFDPSHLPRIWNNCSVAKLPCSVNTTTVTQLVYKDQDSHENGVTASEMIIQMKSRQQFLWASSDPSARMLLTDGPSRCKEINLKSYELALGLASKVAQDRFKVFGQRMVMVEDRVPEGVVSDLAVFSKTGLGFSQEQYANGNWVVEVQAAAYKTEAEVDGQDQNEDSGSHFCKVLSPAKALEWIYVDGLRKLKGYSFVNGTATAMAGTP